MPALVPFGREEDVRLLRVLAGLGENPTMSRCLAMRQIGQERPFIEMPMTTSLPEEPTALESFYMDFDWYVGHARSLAMSPEECCTDQGNYLVAAELFHFLLQPTQLIDDPLGLMTSEQKLAVERFRDSLRLVPQEARSGGPTAAASLADMRQPSWELPRRLANELLAVLEPLATARHTSS